MTKIRLARTGSTHQPHYRIVVTDSRNRRDGRFIEILGSYHPIQGGDVTVNKERAEYWISVGAQPSNTVISLLTKGGVKHGYSVRRKPERKAVEPEVPAEAEAVAKADEAIESEPVSDEAAAQQSEQPEVAAAAEESSAE
jgi:small subunit ribosomal protein S16